jgi:ABC-type nitrate/sulfonate/bicarbonate transport system substrate-binding protein
MLTRARALGLLASLPAAARTLPASAQTPGTIRIACTANDSYLEPYYAFDAGFFNRAGLTASISLFTNSQAIVQAAAGGAIDVGLADMIQLANAYVRGVPLGFFAGGGLYSTSAPTTVLTVAKTNPIRTAKELAGKTIAVVALTSISSIAVEEWLRANGTDPAGVKLFELPFAAMAPALGRGTVDAAFLAEPFLTFAKDDVRVLAKAYDAIAKSFYISCFFTSKDWIAKNPDIAKRLTQALYDAGRWANDNRDGSAAVLAKYAKLDLNRLGMMARTRFTTELDVRLMQPVLDIAATYKAIERPVSAAELILPAASLPPASPARRR